MKKFTSKIAAIAISSIMLISSAIPVMAANEIMTIDIMDLASSSDEYTPSSEGNITLGVVDENGAVLAEPEPIGDIPAGDMVKLVAPATYESDYNFSHYQYVTSARKYTASYEKIFTFYADPPMEIEVVYTKGSTPEAKTVSGMYKDPKVVGDTTYFYNCVASANGANTTASVTFARSALNTPEVIIDESETITTDSANNIYNDGDANSFQYITASKISDGPINYSATVGGSTAQIKTWSFDTEPFRETGENTVDVNGLTVTGIKDKTEEPVQIDDEAFGKSFTLDKDSTINVPAFEGDKVRVYWKADNSVTMTPSNEKGTGDWGYTDFTAESSTTIKFSDKAQVCCVKINPSDATKLTGGIGTLNATVVYNDSSANLSNIALTGVTVVAKSTDRAGMYFTLSENEIGKYTGKVIAGNYNVTAVIDGVETEKQAVNVANSSIETTTFNLSKGSSNVSTQAERQAKLTSLTNYMLSIKNSEESKWNIEDSGQKWSYINGCMITAFMDLYEVTGTKEYVQTSDAYQRSFLNDSGVIQGSNRDIKDRQTLDDINPGKSLLDLIATDSSLVSENNKTLFTKCLDEEVTPIFEKVERISDGNFYHKNVYPCQVWLDGTYMALPYMLQYNNVTGKPIKLNNNESLNNITDIAKNVTKQFQNIYNKMRNKNTGLYYHGYDAQADSATDEYKDTANHGPNRAMSWAKNSTASSAPYLVTDTTSNSPKKVTSKPTTSENNPGCSSNYWLRAMGWYSMALVDCYDEMEKGEKKYSVDLSEQKKTLANIYIQLIDALIKYQDDSGMWYQVVDNPNVVNKDYNYLETSGSAAVAASIMKGYNLGIFKNENTQDHTMDHTAEDYYNAGLKAFNCITDRNLKYYSSTANPKYGDAYGIDGICITAGLAGIKSSTSASGNTSNTAGAKNNDGRGPKYYLRDGLYDYYVSEKIVVNDAKGAAPYLMAYAQKLKHDKNLQSANS